MKNFAYGEERKWDILMRETTNCNYCDCCKPYGHVYLNISINKANFINLQLSALMGTRID
jgi:hypothetical protein